MLSLEMFATFTRHWLAAFNFNAPIPRCATAVLMTMARVRKSNADDYVLFITCRTLHLKWHGPANDSIQSLVAITSHATVEWSCLLFFRLAVQLSFGVSIHGVLLMRRDRKFMRCCTKSKSNERKPHSAKILEDQ